MGEIEIIEIQKFYITFYYLHESANKNSDQQTRTVFS